MATSIMDVSQAARTCHELFVAATQRPTTAYTQAQELMLDQLSRYRIWAGNIGAWHSEGGLSIGHRLRDVPEVSNRIFELLEELHETIEDATSILSEDRPNRTIAEEEDKGTDELTELCWSIGDVITSLMKVSMLIRKSGTDRYVKAASAKDPTFLPEFDIRHVSDKFPKLRSNKALLERLGNAITHRRQFLRYNRNHANRKALHSFNVEAIPAESQILNVQAEQRPAAIIAATVKSGSTQPTLAPTQASTLQAEIMRKEWQEQEDDDAMSEATSFVSSRAPDDTFNGLKVVPLSDLCQSDEPFECPYCRAFVRIRKQRSWRKHVFADLRAYICTFPNCTSGLFTDRDTWTRHEMDSHRRQWTCPHGDGKTFDSSAAFEIHIRKHGVAIPVEMVQSLTETSSRPALNISAIDCPFCDEWDASLRAEAAERQMPIPVNHQVLVPARKFQEHLATHMEQLALFAIPPQVDGNIDSGSRKQGERTSSEDRDEMLLDWRGNVDASSEVPGKPLQEKAHDRQSDSDYTPSLSGDTFDDDDDDDDDATTTADTTARHSLQRGDIVYIRHMPLKYSKATISRLSGDSQVVVREWDSEEERLIHADHVIKKTTLTQKEIVLAKQQHMADDKSMVATLDVAELFFSAIDNGEHAVIEALLLEGFNIGTRDEFGRTGMQRAAQRGDSNMYKFLNKVSKPGYLSQRPESAALGSEALVQHGSVPEGGLSSGLPTEASLLSERFLNLMIDAKTALRDGQMIMPGPESRAPGQTAFLDEFRYLCLYGGQVAKMLPKIAFHSLTMPLNMKDIEDCAELVVQFWKSALETRSPPPNSIGLLQEIIHRVFLKRNAWCMLAIDLNNLDAIRAAIEAGVSPQLSSFNDETLLHRAANVGTTEIMELLIDSGAQVDAIDHFGNSPLHKAISSRCLEAAHLLLRHNCAIHLRGASGMTPLLLAAEYCRDREIIKSLIAHGANAMDETYEGQNVVHLLLGHVLDTTEILEDILRWEVKLNNLPDAAGFTPLHYCVRRSGMLSFARILLKYGADPNLVTTVVAKGGFTAYGYRLSPYETLLFAEFNEWRGRLFNLFVTDGGVLPVIQNEGARLQTPLASYWSYLESSVKDLDKERALDHTDVARVDRANSIGRGVQDWMRNTSDGSEEKSLETKENFLDHIERGTRVLGSRNEVAEDGGPQGTHWTNIDKSQVCREALERTHERFEEYPNCFLVPRHLTDSDIQLLARLTVEIRNGKGSRVDMSSDSQAGPSREARNQSENRVSRPADPSTGNTSSSDVPND